MRLDKYLKVSRIIKRRTVANEACDSGRVMLNDKVARASTEVKVGDVIEVMILNVDASRNRIGLSLKQAQKNQSLSVGK